MKTIPTTQISKHYNGKSSASLTSEFFKAGNFQPHNRLLGLKMTAAFCGCFLLLLSLLLPGFSLTRFIVPIMVMGMCLATSLAGKPAKITVPVYTLSIFISNVLITMSITHGFHIANTYV